ncbi:phospholipase A2 [Aethina tumida]|uniref:phospholipase A2 n=1 Tax=Aethina tumida TaxID=116153 RepID=UPI00096B30CD|nr:phospholipase A2 [Aethina tumida]
MWNYNLLILFCLSFGCLVGLSRCGVFNKRERLKFAYPNLIKNSIEAKFKKFKTEIYNRDQQLLKLSHNLINSLEHTVEKFKLANSTTGLDVLHNGQLDIFKKRLQLIFPGTKWCGDGDIAKSDSDLGFYSKEDSCCRQHDKCPSVIQSGKSLHGLSNQGLFTRLHCDCDKLFYKCLQSIHSVLSTGLGVTYFTLLRPQCFKESTEIKNCARMESGRCVQYVFNNASNLSYQWFDTPVFHLEK